MHRLPLRMDTLSASLESQTELNGKANDLELNETFCDLFALRAYQAFSSVLLAVFAATLIAAPVFLKSCVGVEWTPSRELLTRYSGALLFMPISLAKCMEVRDLAICARAADRCCVQTAITSNRLDGQLYQRIGWSLSVAMAFDVVHLLIHRNAVGLNRIYLAIFALTRTFPIVGFVRLRGLHALQGGMADVLSAGAAVFQLKNIASAFFSLLTVVTLGSAFLAVLYPSAVWMFMWNAPIDSFARFSVRCLGSSLLLLSFICSMFKQAVDEGNLGITTFRHLSIATFVQSLCIIGSSLFMSWPTEASLSSGMCPLLTGDGCLVTVGIYGTLALLSSFNACVVPCC